MVMAMKNTVMVKHTPKFSSTWADTKNLDLMNLLTTKEAKASKIVRDSKWKAVESWETDTKVITMAEAKQKVTISSVHSMCCTFTTPTAARAGASVWSIASTVEGEGLESWG